MAELSFIAEAVTTIINKRREWKEDSETETDRPKWRNRSVKSNIIRGLLRGIIFSNIVNIRYYVDLLIDKVFSLVFGSNKQCVCSAENPIVLESATTIARKIRSREVKIEDVVKAFILRIREVNPILNAVVDNRFKEALAEAKKLDEEIETGEITDLDFQEKPFLGVPFTSKESIAAEGMSLTFGILARKGKRASEDSEIVRLMKKAGGILLGVTNIPQLNMWQETGNPIFGRTNNPYNTSRNAGGSSGGEGSILAAGGSPIGLGTDIGGSIRISAFMCGIFGHKPSSNLINTRGLTFRTGKEEDSMIVAGPMTRYAEDIIPLLKVLTNENASKLKLDESVDLKDVTIYYIIDPEERFVSKIREEMKESFKQVIDHFDKVLSNKPQRVEFYGTRHGGKLSRYWMTKEPDVSNFLKDLTDGDTELNPISEIMKYFICMNRTYSLSTIFNMINNLLPKKDADWAVEETRILKKEILEKLGDNGILLYPSAPWPASYHYTAYLRPWNYYFFSIWNVLKFPVTQVPLGLNSEGLPLGIQVVSAPYNDRLTIAVAQHLEKQFGGYVPSFRIEE